jgi:hypothetical protein
MVRILRAFDPMVYTTLQRGNPPGGGRTFGQKFAGDAQVEGIAALVATRVPAQRAYASSSWAKSKVPRA